MIIAVCRIGGFVKHVMCGPELLKQGILYVPVPSPLLCQEPSGYTDRPITHHILFVLVHYDAENHIAHMEAKP